MPSRKGCPNKVPNTQAPMRRELVAHGLPTQLLDPNWEQIEAENKARHAVLLERLRQLEQEGRFGDVELPWAPMRQRFEQDRAQGREYPFVATQNEVQPWTISMRRTLQDWQDRESGLAKLKQKEKDARRKARQRSDR